MWFNGGGAGLKSEFDDLTDHPNLTILWHNDHNLCPEKKSENWLDMEAQISVSWDINSSGYLLFRKILRIIWIHLLNKLSDCFCESV